ncbi:hypothetical protein CHZ06_25445 [Salmonella enterica]|nr:hypothetical protein [Salmonella enterica]EBB4266411.1 hypothetical protein [Salmonella enterica]
MLKILVIDRCHFTRTGIEALLNHSGRFSSSFLVSGINNLLLAKEHILQWKPQIRFIKGRPVPSRVAERTDTGLLFISQ